MRVGKLGRYQRIRGGIGAAFVLLSLGLLASCNSATIGGVDSAQVDISDKVRSIDLLPRQSQPVNASGAGGAQSSSVRAAMYEGSEVTAVSDERLQPAPSRSLCRKPSPMWHCRLKEWACSIWQLFHCRDLSM